MLLAIGNNLSNVQIQTESNVALPQRKYRADTVLLTVTTEYLGTGKPTPHHSHSTAEWGWNSTDRQELLH